MSSCQVLRQCVFPPRLVRFGLALLSVSLSVWVLLLARPRNSDLPHGITKPAPLQDDGKTRPEYFRWETRSQFKPVKQDVGGISTEQLCLSFPNHLTTHTIQPVLKMGHTEDGEKIRAQLESVSACMHDILIFSDRDDTIHGRQVVDILADLPASYFEDNDELVNYTRIRDGNSRSGGFLDKHEKVDGWALDKYKFLPMIERAWSMRPDKKWYFFYESDTYVFWDNLFRFVENLDYETPLYIGSASPGRADEQKKGEMTWFANGGPGFLLSSAAVKMLVHRETGRDGDYLEATLTQRWMALVRGDPCGDSVLGWVFYHIGVPLSNFWPMFGAPALHEVPFGGRYWCQPPITMHRTRPQDMIELWRWEHSRRTDERPLTYRDLSSFYHEDLPHSQLENWDNCCADTTKVLETPSYQECGRVCDTQEDCLQYRWHDGECTLMRSIRRGSPKDAKVLEDDISSENKDLFVSGWATAHVNDFVNWEQCEVAQWVRPSLSPERLG